MTAEPNQLSARELRRAWRVVTWAGFLGSVYFLICSTGVPRVKFLTELHATAFDFGIIAGLGAFALVFQVVGSVLTNRLRRRKALWMTVCIVHRVLFAGVLLAPLLLRGIHARLVAVILVIFMHDLLAQVSVPLWLSWMADLVPQATLSRYWAARQRTITWATIGVMVLLAFGFDHFERTGHPVTGFIIFGAVGIALGVADILMFLAVPEPQNQRADEGHWAGAIMEPLRDGRFRQFLYFMGYWHFAVFVSAPFFNPFLIEEIGMSVLMVQMLGVASSVGVALTSRYWGLVCDTYGYRPVLKLLSIGKAFTPFVFVLVPRIPWVAAAFLMVMMFLDGVLNSGITLAMQGYTLRVTPRKNRSMYIAAANFAAIGIMAAIAPVISGKLIDVLNRNATLSAGPWHFTGYQWMFLASAFLRALAVPLADRIHEPGSVAASAIVRQLKSGGSVRATRLVYQLHESGNESHRLELIGALSNLENPLAIRELIHSLRDTHIPVREAAADALGRIGVAEATKPLARALRDADSGIHLPAARALGQIGGLDSVKALLDNIRHENSETQHYVIEALGELGDGAAIVPLICLFHEESDSGLRRQIAAALGKLGETESVEEVMNVLQGRRPADQPTAMSNSPREMAASKRA